MNAIKYYLDKISSAYPELKIASARVDERGMNNAVIIVNEDIVFRFPRYTQGLARLKAETRLLSRLAGVLPLLVPQPAFVQLTDSATDSFCGYKMLPGEPLQASALAYPDLRLSIAHQLGAFLNKLHSFPLVHSSESRSRRLEHWQDFHHQVRDRLFQFMRPDARCQVEEFFLDHLQAGSFDYEDTLIHGDFGPSNILWDRNSGKVSGIIDFGSAGPGDPAQDIASLLGPRGYGLTFVGLLTDTYPGVEDLLPRAKFYIGTFPLQDALHGLEHDDREAFQEGIAPYI